MSGCRAEFFRAILGQWILAYSLNNLQGGWSSKSFENMQSELGSPLYLLEGWGSQPWACRDSMDLSARLISLVTLCSCQLAWGGKVAPKARGLAFSTLVQSCLHYYVLCIHFREVYKEGTRVHVVTTLKIRPHTYELTACSIYSPS